MESTAELETRLSYLESRVAHLEKALSAVIKAEEAKMVECGRGKTPRSQPLNPAQVSEEMCKRIP